MELKSIEKENKIKYIRNLHRLKKKTKFLCY